jgi:murein DD-endopeptidase MepM/ murein hydrolase activator NlpD
MVRLDIESPPSVRRSAPPPRGRALALSVATLAVGLAAGFWLGRWSARAGVAPGATVGQKASAGASASVANPPAAPSPPALAGGEGVASASTTAGFQTPTAATSPTASPQAATPAAPAAPPISGPRRLSVTLQGALEDSIAAALPRGERDLASELTAVVNRILVWDLHVAKEGRRGDRLEVLWRPAAPAAPGLSAQAEPVVLALRYASGKLGGVLSAYRFEPKGARFARYYRADGQEVESRLVDAPVADYEQVTSLLRDGRRHKGVDFKTPAGSPVVAPFEGVVERRNWHFTANGNCLDVRDPATGRHAIFLHLDVIPGEMAVGRKVHKGEVIARSGNSGHSFAPHLHYQLEDASGQVLDPFAVLRTERRSLSGADRSAFEAERARLDAALGG